MDMMVWRLLPPEAPLDMPEQLLAVAPRMRHRRPSTPPRIGLRRGLVLGGALGLTVAATAEMSLVLGLSQWTVMGLVLTALLALLFIWIALAFISTVAGFAVMRGSNTDPLGLTGRTTPPRTRAALLMPIYNEAVAPLGDALTQMRRDLEIAGLHGAFDISVLSDSTDPARRDAETDLVTALRAAAGPAVYYRNRTDNAGRKPGNIAEWVRRFGADYDQFLILDADSVMTADTLHRLVLAMERHPDVGLLQTLPQLHRGETLFARLQQFAGTVYGPLIAQGLAWWHGADGNYWGHNAMIRTQAFAAAAGPPALPGAKPFGGHIMSHDFVEAALMRRAGWAIHLPPLLPGSDEQGPPTLPDMAVRDRR